MKDYERLTERDEFGNADIIGVDSEILASALDFDKLNKLTFALNKFADLEDKIESGELVDRDEYLDRLMETKYISGMTDKELEFFAKHNARVRENADAEIARMTAKMITRDVEVCKEVVKKCLQVLRDMRMVCIRGYYSSGWNDCIDRAIEQLTEKYYIDEEERE